MKILIWGTGNTAKEYLESEELDEKNLLGFIESKKIKDMFYGKRVYEPEEIKKVNYDYIFILVAYCARDIMDKCIENNIPNNKLIFLNPYEWISGEQMNRHPQISKKITNDNSGLIKKDFPILYEFIKARARLASRYIVTMCNGYDMVSKNALLQNADFENWNYQKDYCRFHTFELLANEIIQNRVPGECAELGVFRGVFSKLINGKFSQKKLYLFDTFESFSEEEFLEEYKNERCSKTFFNTFKRTSAEYVMSQMMYPEQCVMKVGLFPDTVEGCEDLKFSFVSIDVDFENSILEGLRFFYPRLSEGGAIFVHDYNNCYLEGVKIAVKRYEEEIKEKLKKVPIADEGGTLVIVK